MYILVQIVPRSVAPTIVFVTTVAWLSALHIWRLYTGQRRARTEQHGMQQPTTLATPEHRAQLLIAVDVCFAVVPDYMGWSLDATMILMIWTVKASTFAYNVADGQALNAGLKLSDRESTHNFRADRALTTLPSLLEYFSYVFFFGGVLVGPCFEAKEYFDFIDGKLMAKHGLKSIPNTILPALKCVLLGALMYGGIFVASLYPMLGVVHTPAFGNLPFVQKMTYFWISITASRFKYYFAWYDCCFACPSHTWEDFPMLCQRTRNA